MYTNYLIAAFGTVIISLIMNYLWVKRQYRLTQFWAKQIQE